MSFEQWLAAAGFADPTALTEQQKTSLLAAWKAEAASVAGASADQTRSLDEVTAAGRAEQERRRKITDVVAGVITDTPAMLDTAEALGRQAIEGGWAVERLELELLRASRPKAPSIIVRHEPEMTGEVIEAAVCQKGRLPNIEQHFSPRVLEAAQRRWRHGLGLGELVLTAAHRNGYRGLSLSGDLETILRAAFRPEVRAGVTGPSTYSLPNILANIANKYLRVGFMSVDQAWSQIASTRSVSDFKQITTPTLTGSLIYKKLPPGGEIEHGDIGERVYNNQADTQARMLGIDRRDLINDDLGALTTAGQRLGRGAALRLNEMFWTAFLNNSAFFAAGNNNVTTGAGSALSLAALADADRVFRLQTDPDGQPLGIFPAILLVPTALRITALNLMNSTIVVATNTGTATTLTPNSNVLSGAYTVVSSPYMSNAAFTGNSTTAWYLLASPADLPVIEVVALNGNYMPTVETTDADFNTLGIALRGFIDVGVALQEFRAGVRAAGS